MPEADEAPHARRRIGASVLRGNPVPPDGRNVIRPLPEPALRERAEVEGRLCVALLRGLPVDAYLRLRELIAAVVSAVARNFKDNAYGIMLPVGSAGN